MEITVEQRQIIEIVRPIDSGVTEPFLCLADDDVLYCVKGRGVMTKGKISEVVCAFLGQAIGLPVPDFAICEFSRGLRDLEAVDAGVRWIGTAPAFASRWVEPVDNFSISMQYDSERELLAKLYVFDRWIMNGDRTLTENGGNVNLLVRLADRALVVIDHNLAFGGEVTPEDAQLHVGYPAWRGLQRNDEFVRDLRSSMIMACGVVADIKGGLPHEWVVEEEDFLDNALHALGRVAAPEFWDSIP